jgi:hypothetical protein
MKLDRLCRFQCGPAVAVFEMSAGCICYPADREQALCMQHIVRATPLGTMELKDDLSARGEFTKWWAGSRR